MPKKQLSRIQLSGTYVTTLIKSRSKIFKNSPQIAVCFRIKDQKDLGIFDFIDFHKSQDLVTGLFGEKLKNVPDRNQLGLISDFISEHMIFKKFEVECHYDYRSGVNKIKSIRPISRIASIREYFQEISNTKSA